MDAFIDANTVQPIGYRRGSLRRVAGRLMANKKGRRRSFGSVRQLPSGSWQVRYRDPETGQLRR
ncbi:hypothetical protein [Streptomyces stelliscabiei]|uniref:hypothetical protein n=1 Tax=Streptomyces stelliscabiei TaxID=146820 RepID=UPI0038D3BB66